MNDRIRAREIRVVDAEGNQLGIMTPNQALQIARERGLDLIEVAPQAAPPVCRIIDYGKYKYEQAKKDKDAAKQSKVADLKAIRVRPGTDDHDIEFKIKNAIKFLADGDKVKVTVMFRSREITRPEFGQKALKLFIDATAEVAVVERPPLMEGRMMSMVLSPKPK